MSNSKLVNYMQLSPNCSKPRNHVIDKLTIHHMAGNLTVEQCGSVFAPANRQASANYGIGTDGRVGLYVDEANRSWCSSNAANDNRAVTIEVANDEVGGDWHVSDTSLSKLIDLCVDICQRNSISRINYINPATSPCTSGLPRLPVQGHIWRVSSRISQSRLTPDWRVRYNPRLRSSRLVMCPIASGSSFPT